VTFGYDKAGRVLTVDKPLVTGDVSTGTFSMTYDAAGRLTYEQYPDGKVVEAVMDKNGNVEHLIYPDSNQTTNVFDTLDRVTSISGFGGSATFAYDSASRRRSQAHGNNTVQGYFFDKVDSLTAMTIGGLTPNLSIPTPAKVDFAYSLSGTSQTTTLRCSDAGFVWQPSVYKLTEYGTANNINQYPTVDSASLSYDDNGSLTGDGVNSYGYDLENNLVSVTTPSATVNFKYDPLGRLVEKQAGSTKTRYLYSGLQRIEEYNDSGSLVRRYIYGVGIDECLFVKDIATGSITYLHSDAGGSTVLTTDSTGTPTRRNVYTPWGDLASGSLSGITIGFTGQFYEQEADLYFYKARHYSPKLGRFLQNDPIGYDGGMNLYEYCGSDPVNFSDPLGLQYSGGVRTDAPRDTPYWGFQDTGWIFNAQYGGYFYGGVRAFNPATMPTGIPGANGTGSYLGRTTAPPPKYVPPPPKYFRVVVAAAAAVIDWAPVVAADFLVGIGDSATLMRTRAFRQMIGTNDRVNTNSVAYLSGNVIGLLHLRNRIRATIDWVRKGYERGHEYELGPDFRIAPFGNRTGNPTGELPHYHLRRYDAKGRVRKGQGLKRHRPWDAKDGDKSFWDRF